MPSVLLYYSALVLNGSADDKTPFWIVSLMEYVFLAGVKLVINGKDGVCTTCYTYTAHVDDVGGSILFRSPVKLLDALQYFGLYIFA